VQRRSYQLFLNSAVFLHENNENVNTKSGRKMYNTRELLKFPDIFKEVMRVCCMRLLILVVISTITAEMLPYGPAMLGVRT